MKYIIRENNDLNTTIKNFKEYHMNAKKNNPKIILLKDLSTILDAVSKPIDIFMLLVIFQMNKCSDEKINNIYKWYNELIILVKNHLNDNSNTGKDITTVWDNDNFKRKIQHVTCNLKINELNSMKFRINNLSKNFINNYEYTVEEDPVQKNYDNVTNWSISEYDTFMRNTLSCTKTLSLMMEDHMLDKCDSLILGYNMPTKILKEICKITKESHIFGVNEDDPLIENMNKNELKFELDKETSKGKKNK